MVRLDVGNKPRAYRQQSGRSSPMPSRQYAVLLNLLASLCLVRRWSLRCTNQQPPQRGGAIPDPVWVGSKWLLAFPRVPVTPGTLLRFFAMLPPERPQKGSTQLLQNRSPVFTFSFLLPYSCSSSSPHSSSSLDER